MRYIIHYNELVELERGIIVDSEGYLVAVMPIAYPRVTADSTSIMPGILRQSGIRPVLSEEYQQANIRLISCAPELLAALKEAAYHLDAAGIPLKQSYYDLINRASSGVLPIEATNSKDQSVSPSSV